MHISSNEVDELRKVVRQQQEALNALMEKLAAWGGNETQDMGCQTDFTVPQLDLQRRDEEEGSLKRGGSTSLDNTMRSCMATPRRIENERLRVIEKLKKMEWDTEVQFVGSADDFTETECRLVYIVVTLATFYKVTSEGDILFEIGSECIISIEIFDDTQFINIGTTDDTDQLLYLHADAKSTSSLRLLDVINERFFLEIPTIHSPSMDCHMNDLIKEYQRNKPHEVEVQKKVNLKEDLADLYIYTVEEVEEDEEEEEGEDDACGEADTEPEPEIEPGELTSTDGGEGEDPPPDITVDRAERHVSPAVQTAAPPPSPLVAPSSSAFGDSSTPESGKRTIRSSIRKALQMRFGRLKQTRQDKEDS
eukprot:TRINITY_DN16265_c0_g2_i1.p1 TRINITY_DN16265_c0_g2~~TRINITY_DN16265_c0_g2_i1.p1  ORF type:complete len:364 (+),score=109.37 TRINITY_DN16265_c0_g2_i1:37-1128(+)